MDSLRKIDPALIDRSLLPKGRRQKLPNAALELAYDTGLVEPVVVWARGNPAFPRYELLSGEDSITAAERAGLPTVPAVVFTSISKEDAKAFVRAHAASGLVGSLVEDRLTVVEQMGVLEGIEATKRLRDEATSRREYTRSKEKTANRRVGKRRTEDVMRVKKSRYKDLAHERGVSAVLVSQLKSVKRRLAACCLDDLVDGRISLGHAKALARFPKNEQPRICTRIIERGYSVRRVEASARRRQSGAEDVLSQGAIQRDADIVQQERRIAERLGWRADILFSQETGTGSVTFHFDSLDGYDHLMERLGIDLVESSP